MVYAPSLSVQYGRNSAVSVAAIFAGQPHDPCHKTRFIVWNMPLPSLRVPMRTKHTTCPAFAQSITAKSTSDVLDRSPPLRRV
jgi:hypothetical protein